MSSENQSNSDRTESFDVESSFLQEIQKSHRDTLSNIGAIAIAESCVEDFEKRFSNYSTRIVAALATSKLFPEIILGKRTTVPAIEFQATKKGFDGKSKTDTAMVMVADYDTEGRLVAVNGFNDRQKSVVTGMVYGLKEFKERGILSDLNDDLTALSSRQDSMSRHPSNKP